MTWTPEQINDARQRTYQADPDLMGLSDAAVRAIMDQTLALVLARGGTMTAAELSVALSEIDRLKMPEHWPHDYTANVAEHLSAIAARNTALETEVKRLSECAAVTETMAARRARDEARAEAEAARKRLEKRTQELITDVAHWKGCAEGNENAWRLADGRADRMQEERDDLRARLSAAEEGSRELVRRAQQAEGLVEGLRLTIKEERLAYRNLLTERDELKAQTTALPQRKAEEAMLRMGWRYVADIGEWTPPPAWRPPTQPTAPLHPPPDFHAPEASPLQSAVMEVLDAVKRLSVVVNEQLPREGAPCSDATK